MVRSPLIYRMALAVIALATMLSLTSGATSAYEVYCLDERAACEEDLDCVTCHNTADDEDCQPTNSTSNVAGICDNISDTFCCFLESSDCLDNDLLTAYYGCLVSDVWGCSDDFECADSSGTTTSGAAGIGYSATVSGCLAMSSFIGYTVG